MDRAAVIKNTNDDIDKKFQDARIDILQEEIAALSASIIEIQLAIVNFEQSLTIRIADCNAAIADLKAKIGDNE